MTPNVSEVRQFPRIKAVVRFFSSSCQIADTQTCYGMAYFLFEVATLQYECYEQNNMKCSKMYNWLFFSENVFYHECVCERKIVRMTVCAVSVNVVSEFLCWAPVIPKETVYECALVQFVEK